MMINLIVIGAILIMNVIKGKSIMKQIIYIIYLFTFVELQSEMTSKYSDDTWDLYRVGQARDLDKKRQLHQKEKILLPTKIFHDIYMKYSKKEKIIYTKEAQSKEYKKQKQIELENKKNEFISLFPSNKISLQNNSITLWGDLIENAEDFYHHIYDLRSSIMYSHFLINKNKDIVYCPFFVIPATQKTAYFQYIKCIVIKCVKNNSDWNFTILNQEEITGNNIISMLYSKYHVKYYHIASRAEAIYASKLRISQSVFGDEMTKLKKKIEELKKKIKDAKEIEGAKKIKGAKEIEGAKENNNRKLKRLQNSIIDAIGRLIMLQTKKKNNKRGSHYSTSEWMEAFNGKIAYPNKIENTHKYSREDFEKKDASCFKQFCIGMEIFHRKEVGGNIEQYSKPKKDNISSSTSLILEASMNYESYNMKFLYVLIKIKSKNSLPFIWLTSTTANKMDSGKWKSIGGSFQNIKLPHDMSHSKKKFLRKIRDPEYHTSKLYMEKILPILEKEVNFLED